MNDKVKSELAPAGVLRHIEGANAGIVREQSMRVDSPASRGVDVAAQEQR